ncbi:MBL fold metallo-hydrolase [Saccharopolyspora rhizosphaerae]|uniref:MBL fold metallo-hydrolase n=1 Tax=Saccharopolyspora rhizosphaerae TaxID=2492662 RepID=UPI0026CB34B4|nr:MBL fold metallo-hydrolase [Saccharopolyspora rhizosphaerae]
MPPRVTVLGSCAAFPEPGRACSGFAVDWAGHRIVLDLGYATLPRVLEHWPDGRIDAVVITHEHPDHCVDPHGLFRARYFSGGPRLPLYCPPGVLDRLAGVEPDVDLREVFDVRPLPGTYRWGPFELTGIALPHFVPSAGVRLSAGGATVAYTGDTGPAPELVELGRDADVFIVDATGRPGEPADRAGSGRVGSARRGPGVGAHALLAGQRPRRSGGRSALGVRRHRARRGRRTGPPPGMTAAHTVWARGS